MQTTTLVNQANWQVGMLLVGSPEGGTLGLATGWALVLNANTLLVVHQPIWGDPPKPYGTSPAGTTMARSEFPSLAPQGSEYVLCDENSIPTIFDLTNQTNAIALALAAREQFLSSKTAA